MVSVFPSLIQHYQFMTLKAVGCSISLCMHCLAPLFCGWTQCCSLAVRNCPQGKGRAGVVWRIPCWEFTGAFTVLLPWQKCFPCTCAPGGGWTASPLPPSFSVSLEKNEIGIKERKRHLVHKSKITCPEIQRQPTTSWWFESTTFIGNLKRKKPTLKYYTCGSQAELSAEVTAWCFAWPRAEIVESGWNRRGALKQNQNQNH